MTGIFLDFEWLRPKNQRGAKIIPESQLIVWDDVGATDNYRPLEKFPHIHIILSKVETADDALAFCNRFGPLKMEIEGDSIDLAPAPVEEVRRLAAACRGFMRSISSGNAELAGISGFNVPATLGIAKNRGGGLKVTAKLWSLGSAILFHMVTSHLEGSFWRECEYERCKKPFQAGPGSKPKRRADAHFCSEKCQSDQKNLDRSKSKTIKRSASNGS